MNRHTSILLLAALYHESGRYAVQQGQTLAHAVGQPRPAFTEFADLPHDALCGRMLTAELLLRTHDIRSLDSMMNVPQVEPDVDALARAIHQAERGAIRRGLVVVKLNPPRPWIPFEELPEAAQNGRRHQARYFLSRFKVHPRSTLRAATNLDDFARARASFLASPHGQAANGSQLRWTGTPAEVELLLADLEEATGAAMSTPAGAVASALAEDAATPPNYRGMWVGVMLYEDERGGGFAAEGVGGFTDPATGMWIETVTESRMGPWKTEGEDLAPTARAASAQLDKLCLQHADAVDEVWRVHGDAVRAAIADEDAAAGVEAAVLAWADRWRGAGMRYVRDFDRRATTEVLPDPNGGPDDPAGDDRTATHIAEVATAQDLLAAALAAAVKCDVHGYSAMLQQVARASLEGLRGLMPSAIEQQARELIALHMPGEPPTALLRLAMGQAHVREAVDLLERVLQATATAESHRPLLWELDPELSGMVQGWKQGLDSCSGALATAVRRYVDLAYARVRAM